MSKENLVKSLEKQHEVLEKEVDKVLNHPAPDAMLLRKLKIKKLKIKEEIFKLLSN